MLHVIGTPIGSLKDITLSALDALRECAYILAEDTRVTKNLLNAYEITTPLRSYHAFSEARQVDSIVAELKNDTHIGLVSDAGMPGISDPGAILINACHAQKIPVRVHPGPTAFVTALVMSGMSDKPFQFLGFFPQKKQGECAIRSLYYNGVTLFYEAPHRIIDTLRCFPEDTRFFIGRELTKKFEEGLHGTQKELLAHFEVTPPRGEFVLVVEGGKIPTVDPVDFVAELKEHFSLDEKTAIKVAADLLEISKRDLYGKFNK